MWEDCQLNCKASNSTVSSINMKLPKSIVTYFLVCVFGIGSWVAVNGLWAEISVLSVTLPECSQLPAVLVVVIQVANVGAIGYTLTKLLFQQCGYSSKLYHLEVTTVFILVVVGLTSCVCLALFWDRTAIVGSQEHSVSLFVIMFFLALVDCTSSVVFLPFLKHFPSEYISALYIGEGLSGVLPSAVALSQGFVNNSITSCIGFYPGHTNLGLNFSPNVYFAFLGVMTLLCGIAFLMINVLPTVRKQMNHVSPVSVINSETTSTGSFEQSHEDKDHSDNDSDTDVNTPLRGTPTTDQERENERVDTRVVRGRRTLKVQESEHVHSYAASVLTLNQTISQTQCFSIISVTKILWTNKTIYVCLGLVNFLTNGAVSAISPFAFFPYGNEVYHIAVNLALLANPLMCLLFVFVPHKSPVFTTVLTSLACLLGVYVLTMAILSPTPLLYSEVIGKIIIVSCILLVFNCKLPKDFKQAFQSSKGEGGMC